MTDIFYEADKEVKDFLTLLNEGQKLFPSAYTPTSLYKKGYVQYNGIVVPIEEVSYKFLFDYYQNAFLKAYIALFERLWEEKTALTNEFALRVILEMGIENSFLIFDKRVENDDKNLYLIISLLADYSSIETSMKDYFYGWFNKLFSKKEEFIKNNLSQKEFKIIKDLESVVNNSSDQIKYRDAIKKARMLLNTVKFRILNKYTLKGIYSETENYKGIKSGESHTLHGNIFLIINRLSDKSRQNHQFRVYAYLFISGIEILKRLSHFHDNKSYEEKVTSFISKHASFKIKLVEAWKSS